MRETELILVRFIDATKAYNDFVVETQKLNDHSVGMKNM